MHIADKLCAALFVTALLAALPLPSNSADTASVTVNVSGLNNDNGVARIALFNDKEKYSRDKGTAGDAFQKEAAPIKDRAASHTFSGIPNGVYAIKVYHDEDKSGKFYTNTFGIPKVQYGFSNNAKGMMGPASFDKAKFDVQGKDVTQNIQVTGK